MDSLAPNDGLAGNSNIFRWLKKQVLPQLNFDKKLPSLILSDGKNSLIIRINARNVLITETGEETGPSKLPHQLRLEPV